MYRCVSRFWPHRGAAEIWSSPQVFVFIKCEWVVIGDVLGVQGFGTNSRFYLVGRSVGAFFAFVFMLLDLGEGRDYFKTLVSLCLFFIVGHGDFGSRLRYFGGP